MARGGGRTFRADDLLPLVFAPTGEVEGPVVAIDWNPAATAADGKGCAVTHYGDLPANAIVVVRSGDCLRRDQVIAAQQAGAAAFVAVYPWAPPGAVYRATLIEPRFLTIPAVGVSPEVAEMLVTAAGAGETALLVTRARTRQSPTRSIIAELPGTEPGAVIMLGAHLDSVLEGPGINDDGSGVAALLEIAASLAGTRPRATIRLAVWSGEELGLHGSYRYATALSEDHARAILVYANVDMIASPNGFAGVYDEPGAPVRLGRRAGPAGLRGRTGGRHAGPHRHRGLLRPPGVRRDGRGHGRRLLGRRRTGLGRAGRHVGSAGSGLRRRGRPTGRRLLPPILR